ncbi:hypothetical protein LINPERHAP1_LOCUS13915 [Linum perenne]
MNKLHDEGVIKEGSLSNVGYSEVEKRMKALIPGTAHTAATIKTKFRAFKNKFHAQVQLMKASGMGWNDELGCCVCDADIFAGWVKSHKYAAGLNNTKLAHWEELCKIFDVSRADGTDAMTVGDATSRLEAELRPRSESSNQRTYDSYAGETTPMMEDLINQGFDMNAEGLKAVDEDVEVNKESSKTYKGGASSGQKRTRQQATDDYLDAIETHMGNFSESITRTTDNIERLTNTWCLPAHVSDRRGFLFEELNKLPNISYSQCLKAVRILMKDPADLETFCSMPTDQMKEDFVCSILE